MRIVAFGGLNLPYAHDNGDIVTMQNVDAHGTTGTSVATITVTDCHTIAVCRFVDASNNAVSFGNQSGMAIALGSIVEVYAIGGNIIVFPGGFNPITHDYGTFLDGTSSVTVSSGARFVWVQDQNSNGKWAYIN